jgi:hypothetical protein
VVREAFQARALKAIGSELIRDVTDRVGPPADLASRFAERTADVARDRGATNWPWPAPKVASAVGRDTPVLDFLLEGVIARGCRTGGPAYPTGTAAPVAADS